MTFPKEWKFKKYLRKKQEQKLLCAEHLIQQDSTTQRAAFFNKQLYSRREIDMIERRTRGQADNPSWFYYRKAIITGTITKRVSNAVKRGESNETLNKAITKLYSSSLNYPALVYGRENECNGVMAFIKNIKSKHHNLMVTQAGLKLDPIHPFIGASVDGIITCSCCEPAILEVKCPYSIRDNCVATHGHNLQYLTETLELKKNHTYYYQLQTYLGIYGYSKGYFCVWTPRDVLILEIAFNKDFWCSLKKDLCTYYKDNYLPEYFKEHNFVV